MVATQLMLVNHFFLSLTHNSPDVGSFPDFNSVVVDMGCSYGCTRCSPLNGCLSCKPPFFLVLHRDGVRQKASCSRSCPRGFYKLKRKRSGFCTKCSMRGCEACVGPRYCSACSQHYINFFGTCIRQTPDNELEELRTIEKQPHHLFPGMVTTNYTSGGGSVTNSTNSINNGGVYRSSRGRESDISNSEFNNSHSNLNHSISSGDSNSEFNVSHSISNGDSNRSTTTTNITYTTNLPSRPTKATSHPTTTPSPPSLPPQPPHSPPPQASTPLDASRSPISTTPASIPVNPCRRYRRKWRGRGSGKRRRGQKGRRKGRGRRRNKQRRLLRKHGREEISEEDRYLRKICKRKMRKRRRRKRKKTHVQTSNVRDESTPTPGVARRDEENQSSVATQGETADLQGIKFTPVTEMIDLSLLEEGMEEGEGEEESQDLPSRDPHRTKFHRKFIYKNRPRAMVAFKQSKEYRRAKRNSRAQNQARGTQKEEDSFVKCT